MNILKVTTATKIAPALNCCQYAETPLSIKISSINATSNVPKNAPIIVPSPPASAAPPIIHAAIA